MQLEWVQFGFSAAFIILGLLVFIMGVIGVYKFKFVLNRMHSAAMFDTMGIFLILVGLAIANGFNTTSVKILAICVALWGTGPVSSHLIGKLEYITDNDLNDEIENELSETKGGDDDDSI